MCSSFYLFISTSAWHVLFTGLLVIFPATGHCWNRPILNYTAWWQRHLCVWTIFPESSHEVQQPEVKFAFSHVRVQHLKALHHHATIPGMHNILKLSLTIMHQELNVFLYGWGFVDLPLIADSGRRDLRSADANALTVPRTNTRLRHGSFFGGGSKRMEQSSRFHCDSLTLVWGSSNDF